MGENQEIANLIRMIASHMSNLFPAIQTHHLVLWLISRQLNGIFLEPQHKFISSRKLLTGSHDLQKKISRKSETLSSFPGFAAIRPG
jgi:hypothetical protein